MSVPTIIATNDTIDQNTLRIGFSGSITIEDGISTSDPNNSDTSTQHQQDELTGMKLCHDYQSLSHSEPIDSSENQSFYAEFTSSLVIAFDFKGCDFCEHNVEGSNSFNSIFPPHPSDPGANPDPDPNPNKFMNHIFPFDYDIAFGLDSIQHSETVI